MFLYDKDQLIIVTHLRKEKGILFSITIYDCLTEMQQNGWRALEKD